MTAGRRRSVIGPVEVTRRAGEPVAAGALVGEAERVGEEALLDVLVDAVGARPPDALDGVLGGDLRVERNERRVAVLRRDEPEVQAVLVVEGEAKRSAMSRGGVLFLALRARV